MMKRILRMFGVRRDHDHKTSEIPPLKLKEEPYTGELEPLPKLSLKPANGGKTAIEEAFSRASRKADKTAERRASRKQRKNARITQPNGHAFH